MNPIIKKYFIFSASLIKVNCFRKIGAITGLIKKRKKIPKHQRTKVITKAELK